MSNSTNDFVLTDEYDEIDIGDKVEINDEIEWIIQIKK